MILMPSNNTGKVVKELFQKYPDRLALLLNPQRFRPSYYKYRYAIDNGAFTTFNEKAFIRMIDGCPKSNPPIFVVVPDVVKCHDRTVALWNYYTPSLRRYGFKLAFAAQDGCTPETVPIDADWIFVGGSNGWKSSMVVPFVSTGKPVHVGRVIGIGFIKYCESVGGKSIDRTGFMRARGSTFWNFINHFNGEVQLGLPT